MHAFLSRLFIIFSLLWLHPSLIEAQIGKRSITRAVVIGISNYQDDEIPDLNYAHKDAFAFSEFLKSNSGGSVSGENIKLLIDDDATCGKVHKALNWLKAESNKNDKAYIFFSGHGDVESIDEKEEGHLLLHNTSASIYQLCSIKVEQLRKIIREITIEKNAKAIVITDACRAGVLAGESINGSQATASALYQQFTNEVKIMSCQPNEYSHEMDKWKGGVFTHFLINAMTGLADNNNDDIINLGEVGSYLDNEVSEAIYPKVQTPITTGDKKTNLFFVDHDPSLKQLKPAQSGGSSYETESSSSLTELFSEAIKDRRFLPNQNSKKSALEIYQEISEKPGMKPILRGLKGDLISALQDEIQQSIKAYLKSDNKELAERFDKKGDKYLLYPLYLAEAAKLLGQDHYLYRQMIAKQHYFEAVNYRLKGDHNKDPEQYNLAMESIQNALFYEERAAYIYNELGLIMRRQGDDGCEDVYRRAMKISPTWAMPYSNLGFHLLKSNRIEEAEQLSKKANQLQSDLAQPFYNLATIASKKGNTVEELKYRKKGLQKRATAYNHLIVGNLHEALLEHDSAAHYTQIAIDLDSTYYYSYILLSDIFRAQGLDERSEEALLRGLHFNPKNSDLHTSLGWHYQSTEKYEMAKNTYTEALKISPNHEQLNMNLGLLYLTMEEHSSAKQHFDKIAKEINPKNYWSYYNLATISAYLNITSEVIKNLNTAIDNGYDDIEDLITNEKWKEVSKTKEFDALIERLRK